MRYLLDILQAAGLGSATGIRPFLPALVAGALGRADVGVDFEGTSFAFLESPIFLIALVVAMAASVALARARPDDPRLASALSGIGIGLGALLGAGSLDDRFSVWWPGPASPAASARSSRPPRRARSSRGCARVSTRRRAPRCRSTRRAAGMRARRPRASSSPPIAILAIGFFVWLLIGSRRRGQEKYAGLRILR